MKSLGPLIVTALLAITSLWSGTASVAAQSGAYLGLANASAETVDENPDGLGKLILVLDSSGSMDESTGGGKRKIDAAKSALDDVISGLPDEAEVGLRVFGAKVFSRRNPASCEDSQRVVDIGTDNRNELSDAVSSYKPFGETPIPFALREAAKDLGGEGARSIVLVSDGESTCDPDPCEIADELAKDGIDLQINVVGLSVSGAARQQLQCIADKGNGTYYDADDAAGIEASVTRVAERALRPFVLTGQELPGGSEDSPTPVDVGIFTDTIAPKGVDGSTRSFVFTRELEGTTLRASAITQGESGDDGLGVEIFDPEGQRCGVNSSIRQIDARSVIGTAATGSPDNDCSAPGDYRITVDRRLPTDQAVPFGLRVTEEPPITDVGFLSDADASPAPLPVAAQPESVVGGASFANAPPLGPGTWSSTIVPGEASLFAIPLEFGQAATVNVTYPRANAAARDSFGNVFPLSKITLYNPMQSELAPPQGAEFSRPVGDEKVTLTSGTPPISRALEENDADYSMSGDYYLSVSLMREEFSVELPFTVTVDVTGDPTDGPTYADGATWSVAEGALYPESDDESTAEPSESSAPEPSSSPDAAEDDSSVVNTLALVAGGAGVAILIAAAILWRRLLRT